MITLKQRLTQPALEKLQKASKQYSFSVSMIFKDLEELYSWTDIKYGIWSDIRVFTGAKHPADIFINNYKQTNDINRRFN